MTESYGKNWVDTYGAPVFAPDYSAIGLAAKMRILCILDFYGLSSGCLQNYSKAHRPRYEAPLG